MTDIDCILSHLLPQEITYPGMKNVPKNLLRKIERFDRKFGEKYPEIPRPMAADLFSLLLSSPCNYYIIL